MVNDDERIALFLDYENLAIGARDGLGVSPFEFGPVADAPAERGRVLSRRAYADWSFFADDRRLLARAQVELIEIPQRLDGSRKNAADIKMAVDAIELGRRPSAEPWRMPSWTVPHGEVMRPVDVCAPSMGWCGTCRSRN